MSKTKGIHYVCPLCAADTQWQGYEDREWCPRCQQYVTPDKIDFVAGVAFFVCVLGLIICGLIAYLIQ